MRQKFVLGLLIFSAIFTFSFGQIQPDKIQISAQQELNTKYNNGIKITWDERNGSPGIITFSKPISFDKDQEYSAKLFIKEIAGIIKHRLKKDTLVFTKCDENKGVKHFHFQQEYEGIPVKEGEYVVTVLKDGKIQTALGSFYKDISVDSKPNISQTEALKIALMNQPKGTILKDSLNSHEIIIFPKDDKCFLAYELHIKAKNNAETWIYIINAADGGVLTKNSDVCHSQAFVYLRHPGIDGSYSQISPLPNLNNNGYLQGTYAYVLNKEANDGYDEAYNVNNDFRYSTNNTHFDEANLYYHIDKIASYFHNLGFNSITQITAHAHHDFYDDLGNPEPDAAFFHEDHHLRFSDGQGVTGYNSFAREDKVIYHEYTHAVSYYKAGLSSVYTQSGAICEGNSEYFAASITGRNISGEYAFEGHAEYQNDITNPRIANYTQYNIDTYYWVNGVNRGYHDPHIGGELWSACLWDLRSSLTSTIADQIIYDALSGLPTGVTFEQYRQAIIDKDITNNYGCHVNTIKHIFYLRGIGSDAESVTLSGTLASNQTWYCSQTLQGNVFVPSGVTLTISSVATVNLVNGSNRYSIISTGGTINKLGTITGLRATLEASTVLKGYCGSIQTAVNYAAEDNEIRLVDGDFNENVTISNKNILSVQGNSQNHKHFGTLTVTNCYGFQCGGFGAQNIYLNYNDLSSLDNLSASSTNQTGAGVTLYNSGRVDLNYISAKNLNIGIDSYSSEADILGSYLSDNTNGLSSFNESDIVIDYSYFCGTGLDLIAYNFSTIAAHYCLYDGGTPSISSSGGSTVQSYWNQQCSGLLKRSTVSGKQGINYDKATTVNLAESEFEKINLSYFSINKKLMNDIKAKVSINQSAYSSDYEGVIESYNKFIANNPASPLTNIALRTIAHCYSRIDNLRGKTGAGSMRDFLTDIINNKEYTALQKSAERLMIDYFESVKDYNTAITTADNLIQKYQKDDDYVCDVMYAKGLMLEYGLTQPESAAECFTIMIQKYSENGLVRLAQNELRILGKETEKKKENNNVASVKDELRIDNYPNPFNPSTTISYSIPADGKVLVKVYDVLGREVSTLVNEMVSAGKHIVQWNGNNFASGIYFYSVTFNNQTLYKKMLLVK